MQREMKPKGIVNRNLWRGKVTAKDHEALLWAAEEVLTISGRSPGLVPTFFEVGTHLAGTMGAMVDALMSVTKKFRYVTCDIHYLNSPGTENAFYPIDKFVEMRERLEAIYGSVPVSMIEGIGAEVADQVPDPLMWCFLDGCHCRSCVESELVAYGPKITPGGFLLLHDCTESYRGYPADQPYHGGHLLPFKVIEVVEEWEKDHPEFMHVGTTPAELKRTKPGKFFGGMRVLRRRL